MLDIVELVNNTMSWVELVGALTNTNIKIKEEEDGKIGILYTEFSTDLTECSELEKECRSVIVDKVNMKVLAFTSPNMIYNDYCVITDAAITGKSTIITECVDGTMISFYHHDGGWKVATRRCGDASQCFRWKRKKSILHLVKECVEDWDRFLETHNPDRVYSYVLVHHENRNIIDYTSRFGKNYRLLFLLLSTDRTDGFRPTYVHTEDRSPVPLVGNHYLSDPGNDVHITECYPDFGILDELNQQEDHSLSVSDLRNEGVIVTVLNPTRPTYVKLQTHTFRLCSENMIGDFLPGSAEFYITLYQKNSLDIFMNKLRNETYYVTKNGATFQIKGLIDSMFKVLTSEILHLFKLLWDIKYGWQRDENKAVYQSLPQEYKKMFYHLRGIYFNKKIQPMTIDRFVTVKTVYDMLKTCPASTITELVRERTTFLSDPSKKISKMLHEYHQNEFMTKLLKVINEAVEFVIQKSMVTAYPK